MSISAEAFGQMENVCQAYEEKNKDIRFITFEEGDPHLSRAKHRIRFLQEMEKFLNKNL